MKEKDGKRSAEESDNELLSIHAAAFDGCAETVTLLLDRGVDVDLKDGDLTPLHVAAFNNEAEVAKILMDRGADVNARTDDGWTPLSYAINSGCAEVVQLLIDRGADVNARHQDGSNLLNEAMIDGNIEAEKLLREHGACRRRRKAIKDISPARKSRSDGGTEVLKLKVYVDGACRGNPGFGSIGVVVCDVDGNVVEEDCNCIGESTNNEAEYLAIVSGLQIALGRGAKKVKVFSDSLLIVNQINGSYQAKKEHLKELRDDILFMMKQFSYSKVLHIGRDNMMIARADQLANRALDGKPIRKSA